MVWFWFVVAYLVYGLIAVYVMDRDEEFGVMRGAPRVISWVFVLLAAPVFALITLLAFMLGGLAVKWPSRSRPN